MRVLFATAELAPVVKVGGLGDASSGLVKALRGLGVEVDVVIPDYWAGRHRGGEVIGLDTPEWTGRAEAHLATISGLDPVYLLSAPSLARPDPYNDEAGRGWPDNDRRFFSFSAAVASFVERTEPDVVHLNDWHTGAVPALMEQSPPTVFTMHNPAYQGMTDGSWLDVLVRRQDAYEWQGGMNPLAGAIALADTVTTVSPGFVAELKSEATSFGLSGPLRARGDRFVGILNGIDTEVWDPGSDPHLPVRYGAESATRKRTNAAALRRELGLVDSAGPIVGMVTRLTDQKGVDLALEAITAVADLDVQFVLLGSGDRDLANSVRTMAERRKGRFAFVDAFDEGLAHRIFAGCDLILVPSRFEPCGLTQMQAMRYGAMPVVTPVGGLNDTVVDDDRAGGGGTGFVAEDVSADSISDALARAIRAWRSTRRRGQIRNRVMSREWSWRGPAADYLTLYQTISRSR